MLTPVTSRPAALRVLAALRQTPVGDDAVLVGSSGLFGFDTRVPALTEDIDISIPEPLVEQHGRDIVDALAQQGFAHEAGTATFLGPDGDVFDLLGHGEPEAGDHIGGRGLLRVMVFEDLSRVVGELNATTALPQGGRALTPAGFVVTKLLTERAHKGTKDKIQALLVIAERAGDERFEADVVRLLGTIEPVRLEDVRGAAQDALIALAHDPLFSDAGAEGYVSTKREIEIGLERLEAMLARIHA